MKFELIEGGKLIFSNDISKNMKLNFAFVEVKVLDTEVRNHKFNNRRSLNGIGSTLNYTTSIQAIQKNSD